MNRIIAACLLTLAACETAPETADTPPKETSAAVERPAPEWNPVEPVDVSLLETNRQFVVAEKASNCPTAAEALANDCGNSVEFADKGYLMFRGEHVTTVGEPVDGAVRTIRYTKQGTLPGWIAADSVADLPDMSGANAAAVLWRKEAKEARRYYEMSGAEVTLVTEEVDGDTRFAEPLRMTFDDTTEAVVPTLTTAEGRRLMEVHTCLLYADCAAMNWICDDEYCDTVRIVVDAVEGKDTVVGIADRLGVFTAAPAE